MNIKNSTNGGLDLYIYPAKIFLALAAATSTNRSQTPLILPVQMDCWKFPGSARLYFLFLSKGRWAVLTWEGQLTLSLVEKKVILGYELADNVLYNLISVQLKTVLVSPHISQPFEESSGFWLHLSLCYELWFSLQVGFSFMTDEQDTIMKTFISVPMQLLRTTLA